MQLILYLKAIYLKFAHKTDFLLFKAMLELALIVELITLKQFHINFIVLLSHSAMTGIKLQCVRFEICQNLQMILRQALYYFSAELPSLRYYKRSVTQDVQMYVSTCATYAPRVVSMW